MAISGQQLLSRILDDGSLREARKYGIAADDFATTAEKQAFKFVEKYAEDTGGETPSLATYLTANPDVEYVEGVTDSYEYLAKELREDAAKRGIARLLSDSATMQKDFDTLSAEAFVKKWTEALVDATIKTRTNVRKYTNISEAGVTFLTEYEARKAGTSFKIWRSKFPSINREIGGYFSGNMYAWFGKSGRGKSVIVTEDAVIEAAFQGAVVLVWSLEMALFEWMARAYSSISGRLGLLNARIDGVDYTAGFENRALLMGNLSPDFEQGFRDFIAQLNEIIPGKIILRATDSEGFNDRSIRALSDDIDETGADVVVIDPIYLMDFEANTSRVAGGDVAETSKKLRRLAGTKKVAMHVVTQAEEDEKEKNEDGTRELKPPKRSEVMKTKAILQDSTNLIGIDTLNKEGRGVIEIGKGRNGGEDTRVEIVYLPNWGIVQETDLREQAEQFSDVG